MNVQEFKSYIQGVLDVIPEEEMTPLLILIKNAVDKLKSDNLTLPNIGPSITYPGTFPTEPIEVPFHVTCSCNPKNGGSGICGCVMANKMVPNPNLKGNNNTNI
jgi:hypothetical protein